MSRSHSPGHTPGGTDLSHCKAAWGGVRAGQRRAHHPPSSSLLCSITLPTPGASPCHLFPGYPNKLTNVASLLPSPPTRMPSWINPTTFTPWTVFFRPALVHTSSFIAPHSLPPHSLPGPTPLSPILASSLAAASLVHGIACLAAALITMGPVVAVLCLIAVVVSICTLVLRGAGQEGPGGPSTPTRQPWHGDTGLHLGASAPPTQPPRPSLLLLLSPTSETTSSAPHVLHTSPSHRTPKPFSPSRGPLSPPSRQRPPPSWPPQAHQPQWGRRRHRAHWVA